MTALTIIVPVLDEAAGIAACLAPMQPMRARGAQVVVVDGGSRDATRALAAPWADAVIESPRGRARQMNAGAERARGDVLLFVHADTILPADADLALERGLAAGASWGRFDVSIASPDPLLRLVAAMMNARSRITGIATGDQAIFVRRGEFHSAGAFATIPLMEDIALCKRLKRASRPACLRERVITSGRRWERHGTLRTIFLMWRLRMAYALGADPVRLARQYDGN